MESFHFTTLWWELCAEAFHVMTICLFTYKSNWFYYLNCDLFSSGPITGEKLCGDPVCLHLFCFCNLILLRGCGLWVYDISSHIDVIVFLYSFIHAKLLSRASMWMYADCHWHYCNFKAVVVWVFFKWMLTNDISVCFFSSPCSVIQTQTLLQTLKQLACSVRIRGNTTEECVK